jgi:hypothetical protein
MQIKTISYHHTPVGMTISKMTNGLFCLIVWLVWFLVWLVGEGCFVVFETGSHYVPRLAWILLSSWLSLPSTRITEVHHCVGTKRQMAISVIKNMEKRKPLHTIYGIIMENSMEVPQKSR